MRPKSIPFLTPQHKENRVTWSEQHMWTRWIRWIFSDESIFELYCAKIGRWSKERPKNPRPKFPQSLMIWGILHLKENRNWFSSREPLIVSNIWKCPKKLGQNFDNFTVQRNTVQNQMKIVVEKRKPNNLVDLKEIIQEIWDNLPQIYIVDLFLFPCLIAWSSVLNER